MFSAQIYSPLPGKESEESNVPFLNDSTLSCIEKQSRIIRWCHWVLHGISAFVIVGLLVSLHLVAYTSKTKCWDMFNHYCEIAKMMKSKSNTLTSLQLL